MTRTLLALATGALLGVAATLTWERLPNPGDGGHPVPRGDVPFTGPPPSLPPPGAPPTRAGLRIYERAAAADEPELLALIDALADKPQDTARDFELQVLLLRLAEIDPARAVDTAVALDLGASLTAAVFRSLADADRAAALTLLPRVRGREAALAAGRTLLQLAGGDERYADDVVAALPPGIGAELRLAALAALADTDPERAFAVAAAWPDNARAARARQTVAEALVRSDPIAALARIDAVADSRSRAAWRASLLQAWSAQDPLAALRHVAELSDRPLEPAQFAAPIMQNIGAADPVAVLETTRGLNGSLAQMARQTALRRLIDDDPRAALAWFDELPPGPERQASAQAIAHAYGGVDPEAAIDWARDRGRELPGLEVAVIGGIAQSDPARALQLALSLAPLERARAVNMAVAVGTAAGGVDFPALAESLQSSAPPELRGQALRALMHNWLQHDGARALGWLAANPGAVPVDAFGGAAAMLAARDPERAAELATQVPAAARADWVRAAATQLAQRDAQRALSWLEQFRGDSAYAAGVAGAAQGLAQADPAAAARLLDDIDAGDGAAIGTASTIAASWTQRDPYSAAQWAAGLSAPELREVAVAGVARIWAQQDPVGVETWALGLPRGDVRDGALAATLAAIAAQTTPPARLAGAFSSEAARQRALLGAVPPIAMRDAEAARAFIDENLPDPEQRARAEQLIDRIAARGGRGAGRLPQLGVNAAGQVLFVPPSTPVPFPAQ